MTLQFLTTHLSRFVDVRPGEATRVGLMAAFLFFLLAANNIIKVVRDALFLSRFPITQLPYVYLLAAVLAGVVIGVYSRYTAKFSLSRLIPGSLAFVISNVILFWLTITLYGAGWVLYAYYMWSAIGGLILVAQFWMLANGLFNPRDGKRLFGIITAGGTLGAMVGGLAAKWAVNFLFGTRQLLWLVVALLAGAFVVAGLALRERDRLFAVNRRENDAAHETVPPNAPGILQEILGTGYLRTIAGVIFVSVVVSTLIDYQFKATVKLAYPTADALASFFGSYYAWLSAVTMVGQLWLTGKVLTRLGLGPSLLFLPSTLLAGLLSMLAWPGLIAATATRLAEASLRTGINQSGVQILYLPIPDAIKDKVKVFLDVTVERLADGMAAVIILLGSLALAGNPVTFVGYFSIALVAVWFALVSRAHAGYVDALRRSLTYRAVSLQTARIDFADEGTIDTVLATLDQQDEPSILFALDLAEKFEPRSLVAHLPRELLRHPSAEVRKRALSLVAASLEPNALAAVFELLTSESAQVRSEAIPTLAAMLKIGAAPFVRPLLQSPQAQTRRAAIQLLLRRGDDAARQEALAAFRGMVEARGLEGDKLRVEAARLMGESVEPEFSSYLSQLIRTDESAVVVCEALASAAKGKYPGLVAETIAQLGNHGTKGAARQALAQYGEMAVKPLRNALFDDRIARDLRLDIPRTLSKINSQSAMNAVLAGLLEEDRSLRFQSILALEEMARRFPDLSVDRQIIESAIVSDAMLYIQRFAIFFVLFAGVEQSSVGRTSLLRQALIESMERVRERTIWLLSLIHPPKDIRGIWGALNSADAAKQAYAVELLDNLLTGEVKRYIFPFYGDTLEPERFRLSLEFLGWASLDATTALHMLFEQEDIWLTAATMWEIGIRGLPGFHDKIAKFVNSQNDLLRETAALVINRTWNR
ncbi:MAG: Npt1/Npt2 family nucleotide transporter [Candidatus Binatia bacterium]